MGIKRVVVPVAGRESLMGKLDEAHPGMVRMEYLATRKLPASPSLHQLEWPGTPWYRLPTDYAGPLQGRMVLIIIDAYSKFIDFYAS